VPWKEYQDRPPTPDEMGGWERDFPGSNWCIILGASAGLLAVDLDGPGAEALLLERGIELPASATILSPGGAKVLLRHPGGPLPRKVRLLERAGDGVDFLADGSLVIVPPSKHYSGGQYEWVIPLAEGIAECPAALLALARNGHGPGAPPPAAPPLDAKIPLHERNTTLASLAGTMRRRAAPVEAIEAALLVVNRQRCDPPLPEAEVRDIAHSIGRYAPQAETAFPQPEPQAAPPPARSLAECFQSYVRDLRDPMPRIPLGYPSLDRWFRGLARGEVCVILARTSVGKTTFAQNILERTAVASGLPALFFSLEMSAEEITERILAKSLDMSAAEVAALVVHETSRVAQLAPGIIERWERARVRVVDTPCRLKDIDARIAAEPDVRLVVVDYLGMIVPPRNGSLYEITSEAARSLKRIAGAHRVAMIVLAQIGRQGESGGVPVTLRDGRDAGSIEEAANSLLGCWRPDLAEEGALAPPQWPVDLKVRILKQRGGARGQTVTLKYDAPRMKITDPSEGSGS